MRPIELRTAPVAVRTASLSTWNLVMKATVGLNEPVEGLTWTDWG